MFEQLEKIKEAEGCDGSETCIGMSPFMCFSVTRDYNCKPHMDKNDYDIGFMIWIQEGQYLNLLLFVVLKLFLQLLYCTF